MDQLYFLSSSSIESVPFSLADRRGYREKKRIPVLFCIVINATMSIKNTRGKGILHIEFATLIGVL